MKRIAIITYSRAYNYGSALQTYALNHYLTLLGNDVKTIDYTTSRQKQLYTIFEQIKGVMSILRNMQALWFYYKIKKHKKKFDEFLVAYVPMTIRISSQKDLQNLNQEFDYFICGSDQIWNAQCYDFDPNYMLSFVHNKHKCIAYAPSLGAGATSSSTRDALSKYIIGYKALSSRENASADIIARTTNTKVEKVLDPVFLLDAEQWSKIIGENPIKKQYILGYFIGDVIGMRDFAQQLSKESKLPVIVITKNLRDIKYGFKTYYEAGPTDFISLIKGSSYIVTNSFHAISFSLIFKKSFWAFQTSSQDTRISSILELVNLKDRIIDQVNQTNRINILSNIDFENANIEALNRMITASKIFLKRNTGYGIM